MDIALCQREQEILKWIAEGKTSSEIPLILSISEHTVNFIPEKYAKKVQCT
ncbi:LuxR C-terminal-related transcriptional regulator [Erwinia tracheiphila]|nr:LuxR C-terminal-related transcriptional regulator [Erwinia tracheiphila]UIA85673.1 LuxR C-terminal-related transcriptional regulator [Erwinia tracheiphila]UIA94203.1 LuxR C-terminal-related transcriptional regulator [Erwinia tracheiphila]UIA98641.1 LuxR C-terminal-related transcriptional regulator [Erwinia tracheiphila]